MPRPIRAPRKYRDDLLGFIAKYRQDIAEARATAMYWDELLLIEQRSRHLDELRDVALFHAGWMRRRAALARLDKYRFLRWLKAHGRAAEKREQHARVRYWLLLLSVMILVIDASVCRWREAEALRAAKNARAAATIYKQSIMQPGTR